MIEGGPLGNIAQGIAQQKEAQRSLLESAKSVLAELERGVEHYKRVVALLEQNPQIQEYSDLVESYFKDSRYARNFSR